MSYGILVTNNQNDVVVDSDHPSIVLNSSGTLSGGSRGFNIEPDGIGGGANLFTDADSGTAFNNISFYDFPVGRLIATGSILSSGGSQYRILANTGSLRFYQTRPSFDVADSSGGYGIEIFDSSGRSVLKGNERLLRFYNSVQYDPRGFFFSHATPRGTRFNIDPNVNVVALTQAVCTGYYSTDGTVSVREYNTFKGLIRVSSTQVEVAYYTVWRVIGWADQFNPVVNEFIDESSNSIEFLFARIV